MVSAVLEDVEFIGWEWSNIVMRHGYDNLKGNIGLLGSKN